ncbi:MAG: hypothetical protein OXH94_05575 [Rhodospirillales bacterium]|nr:hypothetical protein [Rhodospirillales bacterium]
MDPRYWFTAKEYGWGWSPATWEGWTVTGVFVLSVVAWAFVAPPKKSLKKFLFGVGACAFVFIGIAWATGEPAEWRWGASS